MENLEKWNGALAPRTHGHGKSPSRCAAFPAHTGTTGPTGPAAHNHHGTYQEHVTMGGRRPCTASTELILGCVTNSVTYRLTEFVIYKVRKSVNL